MRIFRKRKLRKKNKPGKLQHISVICIVIIAALSLLGLAYASWNQTFGIFGSINTGNVSVSVRDVVLESADPYETCSFKAEKSDNVVSNATMNVVTNSDPFGAILVFTVENNGTLPVTCTGVDKRVEGLEMQLVGTPPVIDAGHTGTVKVKLVKGYCK
jgi:hypothetical protein